MDSDGKLGFTSKTFLEHPRVSPDNKYITFYTQGDAKTEGVYVYNQETKKTYYMGNYADKHPTWSSDGKRIFFHEQGAEPTTKQVKIKDYPYTKEVPAKEEIARIGYYDVNFGADGSVSPVSQGSKRTIVGDKDQAMGGKYIYQKHPAPISTPEGDFVYFHAKQTPDGSKSIGVLDVNHPDHAPIFLKMQYEGNKIKHAEHVDVASSPTSGLHFVARDGEDGKEDQLFEVDAAARQQVEKMFKAPAPVAKSDD